MVNVISKPGVLSWVYNNDFINSYISCGMAPPHITAASDFASFIYNPNKDRLSVMNLRSLGPVAGQTVTVKVNCRIPFSEPRVSKR